MALFAALHEVKNKSWFQSIVAMHVMDKDWSLNQELYNYMLSYGVADAESAQTLPEQACRVLKTPFWCSHACMRAIRWRLRQRRISRPSLRSEDVCICTPLFFSFVLSSVALCSFFQLPPPPAPAAVPEVPWSYGALVPVSPVPPGSPAASCRLVLRFGP